MADFVNNSGTPVAAVVTANNSIVTMPNLLKWAAQGKIMEAGLGLEDTAIAGAAAIDDTKPNFALQAPSDSTTLVVPLLCRITCTAEGGAAPSVHVMVTKPAALCATAMTLSGTALTSKHNCYRTNPASTVQKATSLSGADITASALVAADYVKVWGAYLPDNLISAGTSEMLPLDAYVANRDGPHILTNAAAMLVYTATGTSDASWFVYFKWAELEIDDIL